MSTNDLETQNFDEFNSQDWPRDFVSFAWVSTAFSFVLVLVILSFKDYFIFVPFKDGFSLLATLQFLTQIGILCLILCPPFFLLKESNFTVLWRTGFVICISLWTLSTLAIKLYTLINFGQIWYEYLVAYPIFLFLDWVLPGIYIWMLIKLTSKPKSRRRIS